MTSGKLEADKPYYRYSMWTSKVMLNFYVIFCVFVLLFLFLQVNPDYDSTFVFENDFPALQPDAPDPGKWHL